ESIRRHYKSVAALPVGRVSRSHRPRPQEDPGRDSVRSERAAVCALVLTVARKAHIQSRQARSAGGGLRWGVLTEHGASSSWWCSSPWVLGLQWPQREPIRTDSSSLPGAISAPGSAFDKLWAS